MMSKSAEAISLRGVEPGAPAPLGATATAAGVNFSVFAGRATAIPLLLFDEADGTPPAAVIPLLPPDHRTYHYWHAQVPGLKPGQTYAYRADGPFAPGQGLRFDVDFELPPAPKGESWRRCIDTALDSREDIRRWEEAPCVPPAACLVQARSVVLFALPLQRQAGGSLRVTVIK